MEVNLNCIVKLFTIQNHYAFNMQSKLNNNYVETSVMGKYN